MQGAHRTRSIVVVAIATSIVPPPPIRASSPNRPPVKPTAAIAAIVVGVVSWSGIESEPIELAVFVEAVMLAPKFAAFPSVTFETTATTVCKARRVAASVEFRPTLSEPSYPRSTAAQGARAATTATQSEAAAWAFHGKAAASATTHGEAAATTFGDEDDAVSCRDVGLHCRARLGRPHKRSQQATRKGARHSYFSEHRLTSVQARADAAEQFIG